MPRAETWAGVVGLSRARGHVSKWLSDANYTVLGAQAGARPHRARGDNGDVWCPLFEELNSAGLLCPQKVKAHCSVADINSGRISMIDYFGNGLADVAANVAALTKQEPVPALQAAEKYVGIAVLLCLRLSSIEAHCWAHMAAARVPRPVQSPLPDVLEVEVAREASSFKLRQSGHKLYSFRNGFACRNCQRWRSASKASFWTEAPCRLSRATAYSTAVESVEGEGVVVGGEVRATMDLDDAEGPLLWPEEEDVQTPLGFVGPPADVNPEEDMVAPTEAKRLRRTFRAEREERLIANKATALAANSSSVGAVAATSFVPPPQDLFIGIDHAEAPHDAPEWAYRGHASHVFLGLGGFVVCGRCGSMASRDITKSILTAPCSGACSVERRKSLRRLTERKLPYRHLVWPDGGQDFENGVALHRLRLRGQECAIAHMFVFASLFLLTN